MKKLIFAGLLCFASFSGHALANTHSTELATQIAIKILREAEKKYPEDYALQNHYVTREMEAYLELLKLKERLGLLKEKTFHEIGAKRCQ